MKKRKPRGLTVLFAFTTVAATAAAAYYRQQFERAQPNPGVPDELMDQIRRGDTLYFRIDNETGEEAVYVPLKK